MNRFLVSGFLVVLLAVGFSQSSPTTGLPQISVEEVQTSFEHFKKTYNRVYPNLDTEFDRKEIFAENYGYIRGFNSENDQLGVFSFRLGVNQFADLTHKEFLELHVNQAVVNPDKVPHSQKVENSIWKDLPDEIDWEEKGVVTPVKDQGPLGASWVFSSVGAIESSQALESGSLVPLSEQNMIDCCKLGKRNCSEIYDAFEFVVQEKGIDTEKSYPYTGAAEKCQFNPKNVGAIITGYDYVKNQNESDLEDATANVGPISVIIDASQRSFQFYHSGIYNDPACQSEDLNHAVLVVGYGASVNQTAQAEDPVKQQFWKVKNSWGVNWGEKGYIRMARNKNNMCGIASYGIYPLMHNAV